MRMILAAIEFKVNAVQFHAMGGARFCLLAVPELSSYFSVALLFRHQ